VDVATYMNKSRAGRADQRSWSVVMSRRYGLGCKFESGQTSDSVVSDWTAGAIRVINFDLAGQVLTPIPGSGHAWQEESMFLKVVRQGTLTVEQHGTIRQFGRGSMFLINPSYGFSESVRGPTLFDTLSIPKQALRDRGLRDNFLDVHVPDIEMPDVAAIRDFVLFMVLQTSAASERLRQRLGEQFVDLLDTVLDDTGLSGRARSSAATVLRAKQVIARLAGDPRLNPARIASELNVSANYLTRLFSANGIPPMRYAQELRLERAARLLANMPKGAVHVSEIGYRCGFTSAAHFSRVFKERYGVSPSAYVMNRNQA
jgi:AraC-like DNA-binding protein